MKKIAILALVVFFSNILTAVPPKQPTMAVLPFQISPVIRSVNIGNITIARTLVEREFSNQLIDFLTKSRKFNMLSRTQIVKIMDENKLTESDWAAPDQAEKMGKLLVADYLVTGAINRLEFQVIKQNIKITGETAPRIVSTFKCQFQVIESSTGKIVYSDQVINKLKSIDVRREIPVSERKDWTLADYKDLLFTRTASQVGNAILAGIYPVRIVKVSPEEVVLNRGKGAGLEIGERLTVISQGEAIIDVETGESLGTSEQKVAIIEVTSIEIKFSKAKVISTTEKIQYGDICIPQKKDIKDPKPAYPKANSGW